MLAAAVGAVSTNASAQTAKGRARVVVTYDPESEKQRQTLTAVQAHLQGLPVEVVVQPSRRGGDLADRLKGSGALASSNEALGTFSIEEGADSSILVFLTEAGGEATLIRLLPPSEQSKRLATEQAAIVVRSSVESLMEGGRITVAPVTAPVETRTAPNERAAVPPPVPKQAEPRPAPAPHAQKAPAPQRAEDTEQAAAAEPSRLFLLAGYVGSLPGAGFAWQSGAAMGLRWFSNPTVYVGARYIFTPASELEVDAVRLSISHHPMELMLGYGGRSRVAPTAEVSLIAEQSTRETTSTAPGLAPTPAKSHWSLGIGPRVGALFRPLPAVCGSIRAGVDVILNRPSYSTDQELVLAPAVVRPRLDLEIGIGIW